MPEDRNCPLLQSSKSPDVRKKKRKKRNKAQAYSHPENRVKPKGVSPLPETLQVSMLPLEHVGDSQDRLSEIKTSGVNAGERFRVKKKHLRVSPSLLTHKRNAGGSGAPATGRTDDLSVQTRESLRWEGVMEDPQDEEERLELYRANRRQRYLSHRDALLREVQHASRHKE